MASTSVTTSIPAGLWSLCAPSCGMLVPDESFNVFSVFTVTLQVTQPGTFCVHGVSSVTGSYFYNITNFAASFLGLGLPVSNKLEGAKLLLSICMLAPGLDL